MNAVVAGTLAALLALTGWRLRWLTSDGAIAAVGVGFAVLWGGGIPAGVLLALFFFSGSLLSRAGSPSSAGRMHESRTARQVLANGAWAGLGGVIIPLTAAGWPVLAAALAAAQADTWATEIGARSRRPPRLITTLAPVRTGVSGGITPLGTAAGVAGAGAMAGAALLAGAPSGVPAVALVSGVVGMLADSLLGATAQARFHCAMCNLDDEHRVHDCGRPATHLSGLAWVDNDVVNVLGTAIGAGLALAWWSLAR